MSQKKNSLRITIEASKKPRNPLHALLASKRGGKHEMSEKAKRRADKMATQKAGQKMFRADEDVSPKCFLRPI